MAGSKSKLGTTFAWVLMTFVIIGLGGFGAVNFSSSDNAVASVGETEISSREYTRALSNELRRFSAQLGQEITFEQAQAFGITSNVLSQLITAKSLEDEAKRLGISVNDEVIVTNLNETSAFQGIDGRFDKETYTFVLENAGMTPSIYEDGIRSETSRMILQSGITDGVKIPLNYLKIMEKYLFQKRDFESVTLAWKDLDKPDPTPTDEELKTHHNENSDQYMTPETKMITYVILTPEMLSEEIEIDQQVLEEVYAQRISEFRQEEKRRAERLVFLTTQEAETALQSIKDENNRVELVPSDRKKLNGSFISLGKSEQLVGALINSEKGKIIGPVKTSRGHGVVKVENITTFDSSNWEVSKDMILNDLVGRKERETYGNWMKNLKDEADIIDNRKYHF